MAFACGGGDTDVRFRGAEWLADLLGEELRHISTCIVGCEVGDGDPTGISAM